MKLQKITITHYFIFGFLIVFGTLSYLEYLQPYYFSQDDNHRQYLPILLRGLKGFSQTGIVPMWDAYSGLGTVVLNGGYPFFYPPLYLCYYLSLLLGSETLLLEVFAYLHLLAAYTVMFFALYRLAPFPLVAMCAAAGYALSGYNFVQGRCWLNVLGVPFYMACFLYLLSYCVQGRRVDRRWAIILIFTIFGFYLLGHQQLWIYGILSFGMSYVWTLIAPGKADWREILFVVAAGLMGVGLCMPLLWVQWMELQHINPVGGMFELGVSRHIKTLFLPVVSHPHDALYYSGGLYLVLTGLLLLLTIGSMFHRMRQWLPAGAFVIPALFCLDMAMGDAGWLWPIMKNWEVWNKFRYIHKWIPYFNLFIYAGGVMVLVEFCRSGVVLRAIAYVSVIVSLGLSIYNAAHATAVISHMADQPFPPLPPVLENVRSVQQSFTEPYRLLSLGYMRSRSKNFVLRQNNNYASYYGIVGANRYSQRVTSGPEISRAISLSRENPAAFFKVYSIGWVIDHMQAEGSNDLWTDYAMGPLAAESYKRTVESLPFAEFKGSLRVLDVSMADPLVFARFSSRPGLSEKMHFEVQPNGLKIFFNKQWHEKPYAVVASFLVHPYFRAYGYPGGEELPIKSGRYGRMRIKTDHPLESVELVIAPDWWSGTFMMVGCGVISLLLMYLTTPQFPSPAQWLQRWKRQTPKHP